MPLVDPDKEKGWHPAATFFMGLFIGAMGVGTTYDFDEKQAYKSGRAAGLEECNDPSRLEQAAKWLSK